MSSTSEMIHPKPEIARRAHVGSVEEYERLYRQSVEAPEEFWAGQADILTWFSRWNAVFDSDYENVDFGWFLGGRLNACFNCVDRHLAERGDQDAIIWVKDEPGEYEPISPETWRWYHDVVGEGRCAVVDTWWQTETGGILITPLSGATPAKPGSVTLPFFGVRPVIVDDNGNRLEGNGVSGNLCIDRAWPGQARRTVYGDHERFGDTYFTRFPGLYFTGDGCRRDEDGYYWITGRVDDVINVSGHRLGTAEVESALVAHEAVAEAAVVGFPHEVKGQGIFAYVILNVEFEDRPANEIIGGLKEQVRHVIGPFAIPDTILVAPGLPKTRSGKIMRRILRRISAGEYDDMGNITTLADPAIVEVLVELHREL